MPGVKGASGARQKPQRVREIHGSRARPHHHTQPDAPVGEPIRPGFLSPLAASMWDELAGILRGERRLSASDGPYLLAAAEAAEDYLTWQQFAATVPRIITKTTVDGSGQEHEEPKPHPAHQQVRLARDAFRKLLAEGGITPGARSRIAMPARGPDTVDPFEAWARGRALPA